MPYMMNDSPKPKPPNLTPWFPGTVDPVRRGWYDFYDGLWGQQGRAKWNGRHWLWSFGVRIDPHPRDKWRGLAQDPRA